MGSEKTWGCWRGGGEEGAEGTWGCWRGGGEEGAEGTWGCWRGGGEEGRRGRGDVGGVAEGGCLKFKEPHHHLLLLYFLSASTNKSRLTLSPASVVRSLYLKLSCLLAI